MSTLERQNEFDKIKWEDSVKAGRDTCGDYCYCSKCNKSNEYPCAKAYDEYNTIVVDEKPVAKTSKVKKTCAKKTTTKKTTTKKTTAKKTTTKKTTKK